MAAIFINRSASRECYANPEQSGRILGLFLTQVVFLCIQLAAAIFQEFCLEMSKMSTIETVLLFSHFRNQNQKPSARETEQTLRFNLPLLLLWIEELVETCTRP
jgi:hypothetical protein